MFRTVTFRPALDRLLMPAAIGLALAVTAPSVFAASGQARYVANGVIQLTSFTQTKSRFRIEAKNTQGELLSQVSCSTFTTGCVLSPAGATSVVTVLDLDVDREEIVAERCNGIDIPLPQLKCEGDMQVTIRPKVGQLVIRTVKQGPILLGQGANRDPVRFEFAEDPAKFWDFDGVRWSAAAASTYHAPAGRYRLFWPDLAQHCLPVQQNKGVFFDVSAGGTTTVDVIWAGTSCTIEVISELAPGAFTLVSDQAFACAAPSVPPSYAPDTRTVCRGSVPWNKPLRIGATVARGFSPFFNGCPVTQRARSECVWTPTGDLRVAGITAMSLSAVVSSTSVPPEPVALAVDQGASAPQDRRVAKGSTGVPMAQLAASAVNGRAMLGAVTLKASGSGRDDLDLLRVRLVADDNGNGAVDAGEAVLAEGRPGADDGTIRLALTTPLGIESPVALLVVADLAGNVHVAALAGGGVLVAGLALLVIPAPRAARRRRAVGAIALATVAVALVTGCGGGDDAEAPVDGPVAVDPPSAAPPPVIVSYRLDAVSIEAFGMDAPATAIAVRTLPVEGATVTVQQ